MAFIQGTADNETLSGGEDNDTINGGAGNDVLQGLGGIDEISGEDGNDTMFGGAGDDLMGGDHGNDSMNGGEGNDELYGHEGSDVLIGGAGNDILDGGLILDPNYADLNVVNYASSTAGVYVDLDAGEAQDGMGGVDTLSNIMSVVGSANDDTLVGSTDWGFEIFDGGLGNDMIDGGAITGSIGNRVTYFSASGAVNVNLGTQSATGAAGNDTLLNINHVHGSRFNDTITGSDAAETLQGRAGNDTIDGGGGLDTARYDFIVNANLGTHTAIDGEKTNLSDANFGTDTLANIEGLRGSSFNDTLIGGDTANEGEGKYEFFNGMAGNDSIDGGNGWDRADYVNAGFGVHVDLETGTAQDGMGGTDTLRNIEAVRGGRVNDFLFGDAADNRLEGQTGDDLVSGRGGDDTLLGDDGNDTLEGGAGRDIFAYGASAAGDFEVIQDLELGDTIFIGGLDVTELRTEGEPGALLVGEAILTSEDNTSTLIVRMAEGDNGLVTITINNATLTPDNFQIVYSDTGTLGTELRFAQLIATEEADNLRGGSNDDTIDGLGGDDFIDGADGADSIIGGAGNDYIIAGGSYSRGADTIDGGDGNDVVNYSYSGSAAGVVFTSTFFSDGTQLDPVDGSVDAVSNVEELHFFGSTHGDRFTGGTEHNYIVGGAGNDTLAGGEGPDQFIFGGDNNNDGEETAADLALVGVDTITDLGVEDSLSFGSDFAWTGPLLTGNSVASLAVGQAMLDAPASGTTQLYVRTADGASGVTTIKLTGTFDASQLTLNNSDFGGSIYVQAGATVGGEGVSGGNVGEIIDAAAGDDWISGNGGDDTLTGGGGHDTFSFNPWNIDEGTDRVTDLRAHDALSFDFTHLETVVDGTDPTTLESGQAMVQALGEGLTRISLRAGDAIFSVDLAGTYTAADFLIENPEGFDNSVLRMVGSTDAADEFHGTARNDDLQGGAGNDTLAGFAGNDSLYGGEGSDVLRGGNGNDYYILNSSGDNIDGESSAAIGGIDTVLTTVDYSAASDYVEKLIAHAGTAAIDLTGNVLANTLTGNDGKNILNGGTGADTMAGGKGNDTYYVDNSKDSVYGESSASSGGIDTVVTSIDWSASGKYVEYLTAASGTSSIDLTGNGLANKLVGNDGKNILNGSTGADTMAGGKGNDTYYVDNAKDSVYGESSASSGGIDTVVTSIDWSASGKYVEYLTAASGTAAIDLTGNGLANKLTGNDGKNILNGGSGADTMAGGKGSDIYYVDNAKDSITGESSSSSGGIDTVFSSVSFSLAGDYVEQLALTGSSSISGTGNGLANVLTGNSGKNVLKGEGGNDMLQGGAGADSLTGGSGSDRFVYAAASESTLSALDRITDFTRGSDRIDLSHLDGNAGKSGHQDFSFIGSSAFSGNATGQLRFAVESGKVMLYGSTDADATAEFAVHITGTTTLSASDFVF